MFAHTFIFILIIAIFLIFLIFLIFGERYTNSSISDDDFWMFNNEFQNGAQDINHIINHDNFHTPDDSNTQVPQDLEPLVPDTSIDSTYDSTS
ncbi:hypothetical protein AYI69_g3846 [Smittium culicis]|uniref:Uncharacterized protein n=1 Tax=Smittium culicis TaxID=133412 RepID=A0A1R1YIL0_9FUNG|nr:hypothetical protein AYI69_g3846 [Smittium culicis]